MSVARTWQLNSRWCLLQIACCSRNWNRCRSFGARSRCSIIYLPQPASHQSGWRYVAKRFPTPSNRKEAQDWQSAPHSFTRLHEMQRTNLCLYLQSRLFLLSFLTILGAFAYSRKAQNRRRVIVCPDAAFTGCICAKCDTGEFCKNQSRKSEFRYNLKKKI